MTIFARLQITPGADRRGRTRRRLTLASNLPATGNDVTILDVSSTGVLMETAAELAVLDDLEIELPEVGSTRALVIWNSGRYYGCQFKEGISQAAVSAALLRSTPATPFEWDTPLELRFPEDDLAPTTVEDAESEDVLEEDKAPLPIRLRVIFGSAILLWGLIIWATLSLYKLMSG